MADNNENIILNRKKPFALPARVKHVLLGVALVVAAIYGGIEIYDAFLKKDVAVNASAVNNGQAADTAFDGVKTNTSDPIAGQTYCKDIKSYLNSIDAKSKISDICVLDAIANEWLPTMTGEQIEEMAANDPECFITGYGKDGFHCFTGLDRNNCGKNGVDKDGKECVPEGQKTSAFSLNDLDKSKICDLVSGCASTSEFDSSGKNKFGCNRQGRMEDGSVCPIEYLTPVYGADNRDQLGFDPEGFNPHGCDRYGVRKDGSQCPMSQITRVYGRDKKDQFGFGEDGFNDKGCDIRGLKRDGSVCPIEDITHVFQGGDKDQFGLTKEKVNDKGCLLTGLTLDGARCDLADTPRIFGRDGFDQHKLRRNGRNEFHCDIQGKKPDGTLCSIEETPKIVDPHTGKNQFGVFENGRNEFDCDLNGRKSDGTQCSPKERVAGVAALGASSRPGGVDELIDGKRNKFGCDINGLDPQGNICPEHHIPRVYVNGRDQFGLDDKGFNDKGCSIAGRREDGSLCDYEDIPKIYGKDGRDQFGFGQPPFNEHGCDVKGFKADGSRCAWDDITKIEAADGTNQFGVNSDGYDPVSGCNINTGKKIDGSWCQYEDVPKWRDAKGFDQFNLDNEQRNAAGCNASGRKKDGSACALNDIPVLPGVDGYTATHKTVDGRGRLGFKDGRNEFNCDAQGKKPDGTLCPLEQITKLFSGGKDQFDHDTSGVNAKGCFLNGLKKDGTACALPDLTLLCEAGGLNHIEKSPQLSKAWLSASVPLRDKTGSDVLINGRLVKVSIAGALVDAFSHSPLVDANGMALKIAKNGSFETVSGDKPGAKIISLKKKKVNSGFYSSIGVAALVSDSGQSVLVKGVKVGVNQNGEVLSLEDGQIMQGSDAKPLQVNRDGQISEQSGTVVSGVTADNATYLGAVFSASSSGVLVDAGDALLKIDGATAFSDPNGQLRSLETGRALMDPKTGDELYLSASGEIVSRTGQRLSHDVPSAISISKTRGGILYHSQGPVLFDGRTVSVSVDGRIIDAISGKAISSGKSGSLMLKNGDIVNEKGRKTTVALTVLVPEDNPRVEIALFEKPACRNTGASDLLTEFNSKGCAANGFNKSGQRCAIADIPRFRTMDGADQFGVFENGRNKFGCDMNGKRADGSQCPIEETPRIWGPDNRDQFELGPDNRNASGCDLNHRKVDGTLCSASEQVSTFTGTADDINKLNDAGFNSKNCNIHGVRPDGSRCDLADTPRIFNGEYDQFNLDSEGFNKAGCNTIGQKRDGTLCKIEDIPLIIDPKTGKDQFDMVNGRNRFGCDLFGYLPDGKLCPPEHRTQLFSKDNVDQFGIYKATKRNSHGCDEMNRDAHGALCKPEQTIRFVNASGVDQDGLSATMKNASECGVNGLREDGTVCDPKQIPRILLDKEGGKDQFGLDHVTGKNKSGCGLDGLDSEGKPCRYEDIPLVVGKDHLDQFGVNTKTGFNSNKCSILGVREDGSSCDPKEAPVIMGKDGFSQLNYDREYFNREGFSFEGYDRDGCDADNNGKDGKPCAKYRPLALDHADNEYIDKQEALLIAWVEKAQAKPVTLDEGTYKYEEIKAAKAADVAQQRQIAATQAANAQTAPSGDVTTSQAAGADGKAEIPTGMMMIVEVQTPVNSDYTQDVYGKIVGTELDGATVKGTIEVPFIDNVVMPRDKFRYVFTELIYKRQTIKIDAVSVNMDNDSGMVSADDVEYHRWQRYGGLFIASAVQALDASFLDSAEERALKEQASIIGQAQANTQLYAQNSTELAKQNMKTATNYVSGIAKEQFFRRPTIKKSGYTHQVIVFRSQVDDQDLPMVFSDYEE